MNMNMGLWFECFSFFNPADIDHDEIYYLLFKEDVYDYH